MPATAHACSGHTSGINHWDLDYKRIPLRRDVLLLRKSPLGLHISPPCIFPPSIMFPGWNNMTPELWGLQFGFQVSACGDVCVSVAVGPEWWMGWVEVCDRALFVQRSPTEAPRHQGNPLHYWHGKGFTLRTPGNTGGKNNQLKNQPHTPNAEATFVQGTRTQNLWKPYNVGIYWIALAEYSQR